MNAGIKGLVIGGGIITVGIGVYLLINSKNERLQQQLEKKEDNLLELKRLGELEIEKHASLGIIDRKTRSRWALTEHYDKPLSTAYCEEVWCCPRNTTNGSCDECKIYTNKQTIIELFESTKALDGYYPCTN